MRSRRCSSQGGANVKQNYLPSANLSVEVNYRSSVIIIRERMVSPFSTVPESYTVSAYWYTYWTTKYSNLALGVRSTPALFKITVYMYIGENLQCCTFGHVGKVLDSGTCTGQHI